MPRSISSPRLVQGHRWGELRGPARAEIVGHVAAAKRLLRRCAEQRPCPGHRPGAPAPDGSGTAARVVAHDGVLGGYCFEVWRRRARAGPARGDLRDACRRRPHRVPGRGGSGILRRVSSCRLARTSSGRGQADAATDARLRSSCGVMSRTAASEKLRPMRPRPTRAQALSVEPVEAFVEDAPDQAGHASRAAVFVGVRSGLFDEQPGSPRRPRRSESALRSGLEVPRAAPSRSPRAARARAQWMALKPGSAACRQAGAVEQSSGCVRAEQLSDEVDELEKVGSAQWTSSFPATTRRLSWRAPRTHAHALTEGLVGRTSASMSSPRPACPSSSRSGRR